MCAKRYWVHASAILLSANQLAPDVQRGGVSPSGRVIGAKPLLKSNRASRGLGAAAPIKKKAGAG